MELISNGISRKEFFKFTSSGRFISSKTDAKNKTSNFVWDENKGVLLSEQNDLGETKYLYNGMQQISQIIYPDGKRKCEVLRWEKADNPIGALYSKYSEVSGSSPNIIYFNDLGQEIGRESVGLNNKRIYTLIEYNSSGKVHKISSPSHSFSQVIWEQTYHYDLFGRVSLVNTTKGDHIYKYTGLTTETISPEGNKKVIYNLSNELESVIDN